VTRDRFVKLVADVLDSLPAEFRTRIRNLAVLVEDRPKRRSQPHPPRPSNMAEPRRLILGVFEGVPSTQRSVFDLPSGPGCIVLYQKNIEAVCASAAEIRHEVRQTVLHELGHYFGMNEAQLKDV
jgi:predicted Zn-dependent protease with MMP-like domain